MYKRILVPLDGSHTSTRGLHEAISLAQHHGAKLRFVHVIDAFVITPAFESGRYVKEIQNTLRAEGGRMLKKAEGLARKQGVNADSALFEIVGGGAAETIVEQARKWRADLIVLGTHGRRGVSRLVMGSDAEEVARSAPVPVLLVRSKKSRR